MKFKFLLASILLSGIVHAQICTGVNAGIGVNPRDFGAIPNQDTVDNSGPIQQAIDCAYALNSFVEFPEGTFYTSGGIVLKVSMRGNCTTIKCIAQSDNYVDGYLFIINPNFGEDEIKIENLNFDGNKDALLALSGTSLSTTFTENYDGFRRHSLIQAFNGFKSLSIKNCTFKNTFHGALVVLGNEAGSGLPSSISTDSLSSGPNTIFDFVEIVDCKFMDMRTECALVNNLQSSIRPTGTDVLQLKGDVILKNNYVKNCGSWVYEAASDKFGQGDAFHFGYINTLIVNGNYFHSTARYDFKLGIVYNALIDNNSTINPNWGFIQTVAEENDAVHYRLGNLSVTNNHFLIDKSSAFDSRAGNHVFGQFRGSDSDDPTKLYTMYENLIIQGNDIVYQNIGTSTATDAIEIVTKPKFNRIKIADNTFSNVQIAAIKYSNFDFDNSWKAKSIVIQNNTVIADGHYSGNQGLFACSNGSKNTSTFESMTVKDNYVRNTVVGLRFGPITTPEGLVSISPADSYYIDGNLFLELQHNSRSIIWTHKIESATIQDLHITNNHFSQKLQLGDRDYNAVLLLGDLLTGSPPGTFVTRGNTYGSQVIKDDSFRFLGLSVPYNQGASVLIGADFD